MGIQDLIVTPIYLALFTLVAYFIRPYVTNKYTRRYFLAALWVRFFGAIALGVVYQFYYGGGDTFNYFTHGSEWILKAFYENPIDGFRLLTKSGTNHIPDLYQYSQHIWYYRDPASYFIIRMAAIFDLFTFHTYCATALFFAAFNFSGMWALYSVIQRKYAHQTKWLAFAILFFPSIVFWGSGLLKDSVTLGALGWLTWGFLRWFEFKVRDLKTILIFIASFWILYVVKVYILICFLPMIAVWLFLRNLGKVKSVVLKILIAPALVTIFFLVGYFSINQILGENEKYSLDNIAERARITAYDIRYGWGARLGGDGGYDLGELDGTWQSMIALIPSAINVSLFRPYLWEVKNPLMLLSALEAALILFYFLRLLSTSGWRDKFADPFMVFCLLFALTFSFAVGVSTYNFGTLMRYKIPMLPFLMIFVLRSDRKQKLNQ